MAAAFTVETNAGALAVKYHEASKVYATTLRRTIRQVERELVRGLRTSLRTGLGRVSGRMDRSVRGRLTLHGQDSGDLALTLKVRARTWYAGVHERGATQHSKQGRHLTVPLAGAANDQRGAIARFGDGTKKSSAFTAREVIASPGRFGFTGTFTRNGVIFGRLLDHDAIVPLFALRTAVTLRARHPHAITREVMTPRVVELLGAAVAEATQSVATGTPQAVEVA